MKNLISLLTVLSLCFALLTGCGGNPAPVASGSEDASASVSADADASGSADASASSDADTSNAPDAPDASISDGDASQTASTVTVDAADVYSAGGWYVCQLEKDGIASVSCDSSGYEGEEEVTWSYYLLDEEFDDALRFIPQAYDAVEVTDNSFPVAAGQWLYAQCSVNSFTADPVDAGQIVLTVALP